MNVQRKGIYFSLYHNIQCYYIQDYLYMKKATIVSHFVYTISVLHLYNHAKVVTVSWIHAFGKILANISLQGNLKAVTMQCTLPR